MPRSAFGLSIASLALLTPAAHAQTSIYVTGGVSSFATTRADSDSFHSLGDTGSIVGGAFHNFPLQSRVTVGLDGRGAYAGGTRGGYLLGAALRVGFVPHRVPLRPYFQLGGGLVHANYLIGTLNGPDQSRGVTSGAAQFAFGLDVRLTQRLDLRAPDILSQAGAGSGIRAGVAILSVGLVYHLHPRS